MHYRRLLVALTSVGVFSPGALAQAPPAKPAPGWKWSGSLRVREEAWDWFRTADASRQNRYAFTGSVLRYGGDLVGKGYAAKLEIAAPLLLDLPTRATASAPQGALGLGATYRAQNGSQQGSVFVKQAFITRPVGKAQVLKAGRFEFADGRELVPADPGLAAIKGAQVAERIIGPFAWTHIGRSFDGAQYTKNSPASNLTALAAWPTEGVFDLDGSNTLTSVRFAYVSQTTPLAASKAKGAVSPGETRYFVMAYEDARNVAKTDNLPANLKDRRKIQLWTVGAHRLQSFATPWGKGDVLAWGAYQGGDWGGQRQGALSYTLQLGLRPKAAARDGLALRAGYFYASGDGSPDSGGHGTFYPMLNTPRIYARTPFYAEANIQDTFVSASRRAGAKVALRADWHWLALASTRDLWYQAGGPYNNAVFGLVGRPSGGRGSLGQLIDLSADITVNPRTAVTLYAGEMLGQGVIKSIYPDSRGSFAYGEVTYKF